ncbi:class I SAM-dependent methyltransferase [bacterium]|nr:class I SAM-dependent methyltransferase [bacterium]MBU1990599.1 class I SAM-dependent methyltransferase [bacterium]
MSDGSGTKYPLIKEECSRCGTIRTGINFDTDSFYEDNYTPSRSLDTLAIKNNNATTRSLFIYEWITKLIKESIHSFTSILEIGCGQGYLLEKFNIKNRYGIEPNASAAKEAKNIANIREMGFEQLDDSEGYDLLVSYCVIEHIKNPAFMLEKMHNILNENGLMVIALPIQDKLNYDLLFLDHLHHFHHKNFEVFLNNNHFSVINYELGSGSYSNIALYICKKNATAQMKPYSYIHNKNIYNIHIILNSLHNIKNQYIHKELYAFGFGEIAKTILPYAELDTLIKYYIDDYTSGEKVITSIKAKNIFREKERVAVLLLVNVSHIQKVKSIFQEFKNINFIDIFDGTK